MKAVHFPLSFQWGANLTNYETNQKNFFGAEAEFQSNLGSHVRWLLWLSHSTMFVETATNI